MAIALVSSVVWVPLSGTDGGTSTAIDTTGSTLLVVAQSSDNSGPQTISDSKGNTWTQLVYIDGVAYVGSTHSVALHYAANPTVGAGHTFTIGGTTVYPSLIAMAFSGASTSSPAGGTTASQVTISSTNQPGSLTPTEDNCVLVSTAGGHSAYATPDAIDSGFSTPLFTPNTSGHTTGTMAYLVQTTAAASNPTWTFPDVLLQWAATGWFKSAAAGGGTPRFGMADIATASIAAMMR